MVYQLDMGSENIVMDIDYSNKTQLHQRSYPKFAKFEDQLSVAIKLTIYLMMKMSILETSQNHGLV